MPKFPQPTDPTLAAADASLVASQERSRRKYLGMSAIGDVCERRLWLGFRWAKREVFDAPTLKRFEDGHRTEDLIIARLRRVEGLELHDRQDGRQIRCSDFGGHFSGHLDWMCRGLVQAPKAWHVGEAKCSAKIGELQQHINVLGEKNALQAWNATYYAQAQCYMSYQGVDRHWLVAATPGGREWIGVRTEYDPVAFMRLRAKAERIIFDDTAPERIGDATNYVCRMCHLAGICHADELPVRECRNCLHSSALREGGWSCNVAMFGTVCPSHRYLPPMLNGEQIDVRGDVIVYRMRTHGGEWSDAGKA